MALEKVASVGEIPAGSIKTVEAGGKILAVANVGGTFYAIDNTCLHRGGPLGDGAILSGKVVCPWHGWEWDPQTGVHDASAKVAVYPMKIENGDVLIEI